jgi:hypothetical protein
MASLPGARPILAAGGYWDDLGDVSVLRPGIVEVKFALYHDTSWASLDTLVDTAKQNLFDGRQYLNLAAGDGSGSTARRALARCIGFDEAWKYEQPRLIICTAKFELLQECWDSGSFDIVVQTTGSFNIDNTGSTTQVQRKLDLLVTMGASTSVTVTNTTNDMEFTISGIAATFKIDCGALTVQRYVGASLTDGWEYFSIGDNQMGFMALEPGINAFTVTPAMQVRFTWYKAYI